jgi:hypothetical protein
MNSRNVAGDPALALIDAERRRDRFVRRVSVAAWSVTLAIVLVLALMTGVATIEMGKAALSGAVPWITVVGTMLPLVDVLWKLSLVVAALSTVSIFLRMRTASLEQIQLRLAALEEALVSRPSTASAEASDARA